MKKLIAAAAFVPIIAALSACQHYETEQPVGNMAFAGLDGTHWQLVEFKSMDDAQGTTRPDDPTKYAITFHNDGSLSAQLDCNRGIGPWSNEIVEPSGGSLAIGPLAVTGALCPPPSIGEALASQLGDVRAFIIEDGRMHMALAANGGILVWEGAPYPN